MIIAEFEEKEFEAPLYKQLERNTNQYWAPGQCFEKHCGFDRASFIDDLEIWDKLKFSMPTGTSLNDCDSSWKRNAPNKHIPSFNFNLFIQAKRPIYHNPVPNKISHLKISGECYCFKISNHQQQALENVYHEVQDKAIMLYASPVFHTSAELERHTKYETIIENTSFPPINEFDGHSAWYYNKYGGVACSEPKPIKQININERVNRFVESQKKHVETGYFYGLRPLSSGIRKGLKHMHHQNLEEITLFYKKTNEAYRQLEYSEYSSFYKDFMKCYIDVLLYCKLFYLNWYVLSEI